ncbi:MAG: hypothetical protein ACLS90_06285 [Clostridia bacterium]|mgnify:FL=1
MENVADALKMAADFLVFITALAIGITSFSQARSTAQILLNYTDREYETQYVESTSTTDRVVGAETIIPTIYRAYKENYKIMFYNSDDNNNKMELFKKGEQPINYIDLGSDSKILSLADDAKKDDFIMVLLYGNKAKVTTVTTGEDFRKKMKNEQGINLPEDGIYGTIKSSKFIERFGVYYPDEERESSDTGDESSSTNVPTANKDKKRIISYYLTN